MSKLSKLRALSAQEWRWLSAALILLPAMHLSLRAFGFKRVHTHLLRQASLASPGPPSITDSEISRLARMVDVAANRFPVRIACLPRSLTLWWLLQRRGVSANLCIGARTGGETFESHAWLEKDGRAINDRVDAAERFTKFDLSGASPGTKCP